MDSGVTSSSDVTGTGNDVVRLNVGGTPFTTTLTTLTSEPDSMLGAMFSGRHETKGAVLEDGSIVIDRSGRLFHHVLAWLRDRTLPKQLSEEERQLLLIEANYYCLQGLMWRLKLPHFTKPLQDIRCIRELRGHIKSVRSIVPFLGLGNQVCLASAGFDTTVEVWNASTGELYRTLAGHTDSVYALAVFTSAEGQLWLACGSIDGGIKLWNPSDGELLRTLAGHTGYVMSLAFFVNTEKQICLASASLSADRAIRLWDTSTGELRRTLTGHGVGVDTLVAFVGADGRTCLASGSRDGIKIWDPTTGGTLRTLSVHNGVLDLVVFTSTESQLCLASVTRMMDRAEFTRQTRLPRMGETRLVNNATAQRGRRRAIVKVWDPATGDLLRTFSVDTGADVVFSLSSAFIGPEEQVCLAGVTFDKTIQIWNASTGNLLNTIRTDTTLQCVTVFTDSQGIACLAIGTSEMYSAEIKLWG